MSAESLKKHGGRHAAFEPPTLTGGGPLPPQGEWTYQDYLRLPDDGWRYEVIRGVLHVSPAPSPRHQAVVRNLAFRLGRFLDQHPLGELFFAPVDLILPGLASPVQPDLLFIAGEHRGIVKDTLIEGVPDLMVEVLSPANWLTDRREKQEAYAQAGVPEYWILDPRLRTIEVYVLGTSTTYELLGTFRPGERARSQVLAGFEPAVDDIFPG